MLTEIITGASRRKLYVIFAIIGVTLGGTQVGFASADLGQPVWLNVALAVFAFLGTAFGFTASANVPAMAAGSLPTELRERANEAKRAYPIAGPHEPTVSVDPADRGKPGILHAERDGDNI